MKQLKTIKAKDVLNLQSLKPENFLVKYKKDENHFIVLFNDAVITIDGYVPIWESEDEVNAFIHEFLA